MSEAVGQRLARALARHFGYAEPGQWCWETAEALLPTVRAYAAEQIRRIAYEHRAGSGEVWLEELHRAAHNLDPEYAVGGLVGEEFPAIEHPASFVIPFCPRCHHRAHGGRWCGVLPDDEVKPYRCECIA